MFWKDNSYLDPLSYLRKTRHYRVGKLNLDNIDLSELNYIIDLYNQTKDKLKTCGKYYSNKTSSEIESNRKTLNQLSNKCVEFYNDCLVKTGKTSGFIKKVSKIEVSINDYQKTSFKNYFKIYENLVQTCASLIKKSDYNFFPWQKTIFNSKDLDDQIFFLPVFHLEGSKYLLGENFKKFFKKKQTIHTNYLGYKFKYSEYDNDLESPDFTKKDIENLFLSSLMFNYPSGIAIAYVEENVSLFEKKYLKRISNKIRSIEREDHLKSKDAFVYVLSNKSLDKLYKIGFTTGLPKDRASELSSTELPYPYEVELTLKIKDAEFTEKLVHKLLNEFRVTNNREFFKIPLKKISKIFEILKKNEHKIREKDTIKSIEKEVNVIIN